MKKIQRRILYSYFGTKKRWRQLLPYNCIFLLTVRHSPLFPPEHEEHIPCTEACHDRGESEEPPVAQLLGHVPAQHRHEDAAKVGNDGLDGEVGSFQARTHPVHGGGVNHHGAHGIARPQQDDARHHRRPGGMDV